MVWVSIFLQNFKKAVVSKVSLTAKITFSAIIVQTVTTVEIFKPNYCINCFSIWKHEFICYQVKLVYFGIFSACSIIFLCISSFHFYITGCVGELFPLIAYPVLVILSVKCTSLYQKSQFGEALELKFLLPKE